MVSLKKYVPCKCGANNSFDFSSDMSVEDLTLAARCPACGTSVCISISALLSQSSPSPSPVTIAEPAAPAQHLDPETKENVEQAVRDLFR